ncbi:MAG: diacylglycerol kinase family protein [Gloeomargaritaceae cyanobacterium C42_A2020_066]|nr:diacylglycerol kinase family protein [Gloeomargaritaceae cyanobacterium C42_A2020_066]
MMRTPMVSSRTTLLRSIAVHRQQTLKTAADLPSSFRYAWDGVRYATFTQRNFRIHLVIGTIALGGGLLLGVSPLGLAVITLNVALVLVLELINTALEASVDLTVGQTYHQLAKIAKDCAAGAVLVASGAAVVTASLLLLPPLAQHLAPLLR